MDKNQIGFLRLIIEMFDLDFIMRPWLPERGKIIEKGIATMVQKNDDCFLGMIPWTSSLEQWNQIVISTSIGLEKIKIPKAVYDRVRVGENIEIKVRKSRWFSDRIHLRPAREK